MMRTFGSSGTNRCFLKHYEPAMTDLEAGRRRPDYPGVRDMLAECYNNRAWELANGRESRGDS